MSTSTSSMLTPGTEGDKSLSNLVLPSLIPNVNSPSMKTAMPAVGHLAQRAGNINSGEDHLLKKTLTIDLDPELYDSWCDIGINLNLTAHSQIVAFLINFYQDRDNWTARRNCETCGAGLTLNCPGCLNQQSPQFVESSDKTQEKHQVEMTRGQLHTVHQLDKNKSEQNPNHSKFIVKTKQNPVQGMSPMEEDSDDSPFQGASFDACPNSDSDRGDKTFIKAQAKPTLVCDVISGPAEVLAELVNVVDNTVTERPAKKKFIQQQNKLTNPNTSPKVQTANGHLQLNPFGETSICQKLSVDSQCEQKPVQTFSLPKANSCSISPDQAVNGAINVDKLMCEGPPQQKQMKIITLPENNVLFPLPELQTTNAASAIDQLSANTPNNVVEGQPKHYPGKIIFIPVTSIPGPLPELQAMDCDEKPVQEQKNLKQVKMASPEKSAAGVSSRWPATATVSTDGRITNGNIGTEKLNKEKINRCQFKISVAKNIDSISAPALKAANIKTPVNNVDNKPVQGQSNNPVKISTPVQGLPNNPVNIDAPVEGQLNNSVKINTPVQLQPNNPTKIDAPVQGQLNNPVMIHTPVQGKLSNPVKINTPVQGQPNNPTKIHTPVQGKLSNPVKINTPVQLQPNNPVKTDAPVQGQPINPVMIHTPVQGQLNNPAMIHTPAEGQLSNPVKINTPVQLQPNNLVKSDAPVQGQPNNPVMIHTPVHGQLNNLMMNTPVQGQPNNPVMIHTPVQGQLNKPKMINAPVQAPPNNSVKMISLLKKNVAVPFPKAQATNNNVSDSTVTQGQTKPIPVNLLPLKYMTQAKDNIVSPPVLPATNSSISNKTNHGQTVQTPMTMILFLKKLDPVSSPCVKDVNAVSNTVPSPCVQSVNAVSNQAPLPCVQSVNAICNQVGNSNITKSKTIHWGSNSSQSLFVVNGQWKLPSVSGAAKVKDPYKAYWRRQRFPQRSSNGTYDCRICSKSYYSLRGYKNHKDQHKGNLTCCPICKKKFSTLTSMKSHHNVIHLGHRPFKCDLCDKQFSLKSALKTHKLLHGDETPYHCFCGKSFKTTLLLKAHSKRVHRSSDQVCEVCGKAFKLLKNLERHRKAVHQGLKGHVCEFCSKSFSMKSSLMVHRSGHTGEPWLGRRHQRSKVMCETCGKWYPSNYINQHRRMHTGEKPYFCGTCTKRYAFFHSYQSHIRTHKGERPYICEVCGKSFGNSSCLISHRRLHDGSQKVFQCQVCLKVMKNHNNFRRHVNSHQTDGKPLALEASTV